VTEVAKQSAISENSTTMVLDDVLVLPALAHEKEIGSGIGSCKVDIETKEPELLLHHQKPADMYAGAGMPQRLCQTGIY